MLLCARSVAAALRLVRTSVLTAVNGDRSNVSNWVLTVVDNSSANLSATVAQANLLREVSNTTLFAIRIGSNVAQSELVSLASSASYVFRFNYSDLISGFAEKFICLNLVNSG